MNRLHWTGGRIGRMIAAALVMLGGGLIATGATAAPCTQNCLTPGDYNLSMTSGGYLRLYLLHVPASYDGSKPVALALDVHGHALTDTDQRTRSGQLQQSDKRGFIVAWPQGIANSWNGEGCCTVAYDLKIDDVGFLRALIAQIEGQANIDPTKVYVTGWSNGGGMAERMGCEAADVVRAIASVAHPLNTNSCAPARAISVLEFHGTADTTIPYDGGGDVLPRETLGVPLGWQGALASLAEWKAILHCSDALTQTQLNGASRDQTYATCAAGVTAGLVSVANGQHDLYTDTTPPDPNHIDVADYIWTHVFRQ